MSGAAIAAIVAGTAVSYYTSQQSLSAQKKATAQAKQSADKQAQLEEEQLNAANKRRADPSAALSAAELAGKGGVSGTMLTGSSGVSTGSMSLGGSSMLGA